MHFLPAVPKTFRSIAALGLFTTLIATSARAAPYNLSTALQALPGVVNSVNAQNYTQASQRMSAIDSVLAKYAYDHDIADARQTAAIFLSQVTNAAIPSQLKPGLTVTATNDIDHQIRQSQAYHDELYWGAPGPGPGPGPGWGCTPSGAFVTSASGWDPSWGNGNLTCNPNYWGSVTVYTNAYNCCSGQLVLQHPKVVQNVSIYGCPGNHGYRWMNFDAYCY